MEGKFHVPDFKARQQREMYDTADVSHEEMATQGSEYETAIN